MALYKTAKNMTIEVAHKYQLFVGGKLEKVNNVYNVQATTGNLKLISNKKVIANGDKR